jgi:uncharacterized protein YodC (DUF2158 family)
MAMFSVGEDVRRKWDDRRGVVREVQEGAIRQDSYLVKWFDGGEDWESEDQLLPA